MRVRKASEATAITDQRTLQTAGLNSEISSVARNHKWMNRLVILAGILAISIVASFFSTIINASNRNECSTNRCLLLKTVIGGKMK